LRARIWGTRGSLPSPGPDTFRYGGNTSCIALEAEGRTLILDAGTGIRLVGHGLGPGRVDVLLTHLHMDHIQGLGFFPPLFQPDREVHLWGPPSTLRSLKRRLGRYFSPPLFPVRLPDLQSRLVCHDVVDATWDLGPFRISAELVCHPDPTLGYRIDHGGRAFCYLPDHEPQLGAAVRDPRWLSGFRLAQGADLLVHDAQYSEAEYATRRGWGHATPEVAVAFAALTGASRLLLFHHDPAHDDGVVEVLAEAARKVAQPGLRVEPAAEGQTWNL